MSSRQIPILVSTPVPDYMGPEGSDDYNGRQSDSEYEDDIPDYHYITENGRQYLERSDIYLPVDQKEARRQNLQHCLLKMLFAHRSFFAPIVNPRRILDIGTGTGKWVQDVSEIFPDATVVGSDIHPLIAGEEFSENVEIVSEDASKGDFGDHPYSFIHTRHLNGCFNDFRQIVNHSYKYLEPGGYLECHEIWPLPFIQDQDYPPGSHLKEWVKLIDEAMMELARPLRTGNKIKGWMTQAGFTDVKEEVFRMPLKEWPTDPSFRMIGKYNSVSFREGLSGASFRPFREAFGWSAQETEVFVGSVKEEILNSDAKYYFNVYAVWGKKPNNAVMQPLGSNDPTNLKTNDS